MTTTTTVTTTVTGPDLADTIQQHIADGWRLIAQTTHNCLTCGHWFALPRGATGLCGIRETPSLDPIETKAGASCPKWRGKSGVPQAVDPALAWNRVPKRGQTVNLKKESFTPKPLREVPVH